MNSGAQTCSTQHSALSTQHSALSTQRNLVALLRLIIAAGYVFLPSISMAATFPRVKIFESQVAQIPNDNFVLVDSVSASTCGNVLDLFPSYYANLTTPYSYVDRSKATPTSAYAFTGGGVISCRVGELVYIAIPPGQYRKPDPQMISVVHGISCEGPQTRGDYDGTFAHLQVVNNTAYCECPPYPNWSWDGNYCVMGAVTNPPPPTLIGYFNGVANTRDTAQDSLNRLRIEYGTKYKTKPLVYDLFYNQTTCELGAFRLGKIPCLEDIAEVFEQRTSELNSGLKNRWEHFWEMLSGRAGQDGSLTATLTSKLGKFGENILQLLDSIYALVINQFVGSFVSFLNSLNGTPTLADNAAHVVKLKTYADKGSGMVLVAHSQGNLFVNLAYDGIKIAAPSAKVQVVHVAPASTTLRGAYALADVDFVIRSLRQLVSGLPSVNIQLPLSPNDRTGHAFEGTYLDISRRAYERVKTMINTALDGV